MEDLCGQKQEAYPVLPGVEDTKEVSEIVCDKDAGMVERLFAMEDDVRAVFSCIVGRPNMPSIKVSMDEKDSYVSVEVHSKRCVLTLKYSFEHGLVTNCEDVEQIWNRTLYNEMPVASEEQRGLLTKVT